MPETWTQPLNLLASKPIVRKVKPLRILPCDQPNLLFSPPVLELLLARDGIIGSLKRFDVHEHGDVVVTREAVGLFLPVLPDAFLNVVGNPI